MQRRCCGVVNGYRWICLSLSWTMLHDCPRKHVLTRRHLCYEPHNSSLAESKFTPNGNNLGASEPETLPLTHAALAAMRTRPLNPCG